MQLRVYGGRMRPPTRFLVEELCERPLSAIIHRRGKPMPMPEVIRVRAVCV